jgi:hypothetical protein
LYGEIPNKILNIDKTKLDLVEKDKDDFIIVMRHNQEDENGVECVFDFWQETW